MAQSQDIHNDDSGIKSLSGFAYQMRVFIYYMSQMCEGSQIEFETLEDVVINNNTNTFLDNKSQSFRSLYKGTNGFYAIQVKRTKITNDTKDKLLYNWLLLQSSHKNIGKFILYTEAKYGNKGEIFDYSAEELYKKVITSKKKSSALVSKVKLEFKDNLEKFKTVYKYIEENYEFIPEENLNDKILEGFALHFRRNVVSEITYALRVKELIINITGEIISAIDNGESYVCSYYQMLKKIEEITIRVQDNIYNPDFIAFKKARRINLSDPNILRSREYLQLLKCNLSEKRIEEHLMYQQYYEDIRDRFLLDSKPNEVENIEEVTYENFCSVKDELQSEGDLPIKRLNKTKDKHNYYALKNQTRYGSCIFLTKEDIEDDKKISWEDD